MEWRSNLSPGLWKLYHQHALASFEKQLRLRSLIEELDWHVDLASGTIRFDSVWTFPIQVLGTVSDSDQAWLWAWANSASKIPSNLLAASEQVKQMGQQLGVPELTKARLVLQGFDPHCLALLASAVSQADAYFRAPYAGGAAFVTLHDPKWKPEHRLTVERALVVSSQAVALLPLPDPRLAILEYLTFLGLNIHQRENALVVTEDRTPVLRITFDENGKVVQIKALIGDISVPRIPDRSILPILD